MADRNFDWEIAVVDRFSGPLERLQRGLESAEGAFQSLRTAASTGLTGGAQVIRNEARAVGDLAAATQRLNRAQSRASRDAQNQAAARAAAARAEVAELRAAAAARGAVTREAREADEAAIRSEKLRAAAARRRTAELNEQITANRLLIQQEKERLRIARQLERAQRRAQEPVGFLGGTTQAQVNAQRKASAATEKEEDAVLKRAAAARDLIRRIDEGIANDRLANLVEAEKLQKRIDKDARAEAKRREREFAQSPQGRAQAIIDRANIRALTEAELAARGFNAQGERLRSGLAALRDRLNDVGRTLTRLTAAFLAFRAFQLIGDSIRGTVRSVFDYNKAIEDSNIGIASLLATTFEVRDATGNVVDSGRALGLSQKEAAKQTRLLRGEALRTAASFTDLAFAFQTALAPGAAAGLSVDQIRKFSVQAAQAAAALGLESRQLSEEIRSVLEGTGRPGQTRFLSIISNDEIRRARDAGNLFEVLNQRFSQFTNAADVASQNFSVIFSNFREALETALGEGGRPIFDAAKKALDEITKSLIEVDQKSGEVQVNQRFVRNMRALSEALVDVGQAIRAVAPAFEDLAAATRGFLEAAKAINVGLSPVSTTLNKFFGQDVRNAVGQTAQLVFGMGTLADKTAAVVASAKVAGLALANLFAQVGPDRLKNQVSASLVTAIGDAAAAIRKAQEGALVAPITPREQAIQAARTALFLSQRQTIEGTAKALEELDQALSGEKIRGGFSPRRGFDTEAALAFLQIDQQRIEANKALLALDRERLDIVKLLERDQSVEVLVAGSQRLLAVEQDRAAINEKLGQLINTQREASLADQRIKQTQENQQLQIRLAEAEGRDADALRLKLQLLTETTNRRRDELAFLTTSADLSEEATNELLKQIDLLDQRFRLERQILTATRPPTRQGAGATAGETGPFVQWTAFGSKAGADFQEGFKNSVGQIDQVLVDLLLIDPDDETKIINSLKDLLTNIEDLFKESPLGFVASFFGGAGFFGQAQQGTGFVRGGRVPGYASPSLAHFANPQGFARGGRPRGIDPRDTVPIWTQPGEWVMRLAAVKKYGADAMARINAGMADPAGIRAAVGSGRVGPMTPKAPSFAEGGLVSQRAAPPAVNVPPPTVAPVMVADAGNVERLLSGGRTAVLRFMRDNAHDISAALGG